MLWFVLLACSPEDPDPQPVDTGEAQARQVVQFALPLADASRISSVVGVDHDPVYHDDATIPGSICEDYAGRPFPYCYDNHDGTDYLLQGGFTAMDAGSMEIWAAADGVVVDTADGNYDRCHADLQTREVDCDGYPMKANYVIVEHTDGIRTLYWHMKQDSVAVTVGQQVVCGETLGLVGSSGNSSTPHLHFEVHLPDGTVVDPYLPDGSTDPAWWVDQGIELPESVCDAR